MQASGIATATSIGWAGDGDTGLFHPAADVVAMSAGGSERLRVTSAEVILSSPVEFNAPNRNTPVMGSINPWVYRTTSGGSFPLPYNGTGNLVIQGRSDGNAASHIAFVVGAGDPVLGWMIVGNPASTSFGALYAGLDGSAANPIITWNADNNTGIYRANADVLGFTAGGTLRFQVGTQGPYVTSGNFRRSLSALAGTTGTQALDFALDSFRTLNIGAGNVTFTFSNLAEGRKITLRIHNTSGATRTINWPANTKLSSLAQVPTILAVDYPPTSIDNNRGMVIDIISWAANATNVTASVVAAYAL